MECSLYEEHALLEQDHWWFVGRRTILEHLIRRRCQPSAIRRILDVGCGTGGMLPMLGRFGHVEGIEGDELAVEHCQLSYPAYAVRKGTVPGDVPSDGAFDLVTAFDVIEHIDDDHAAVSALAGAVRPRGTVVVTVPALASLWSDHDVVNGHKRRYSRRGLAAVLTDASLDLQHASYFNTALLPAVATVRLAQRLRPPSHAPESDFTMPSPRVNSMLTRVLAAERRAVSRFGLPSGVSLVAVARRPAAL